MKKTRTQKHIQTQQTQKPVQEIRQEEIRQEENQGQAGQGHANQEQTREGQGLKQPRSGQAALRSSAGSLVFDAFECSRRGLEYGGEVPLARLVRLVEDLPAQHGVVSWRVHGETGPLGEALLQLAVKASPVVVCQRCLEPFEWPVDSEVALQLVRSQAELDADAPISDEEFDEGYDKVLGSSHFDILEQIEDELILAMPYIARHPVCPTRTPSGDDAAEPQPERRNPFASLGELRDKLKKD